MPSPPPTLPPIRALGIDLPPLHSDLSSILHPPAFGTHDHETHIAATSMPDTGQADATAAQRPAPAADDHNDDDDDDEGHDINEDDADSYDDDGGHGDDISSSDDGAVPQIERDPFPWKAIIEDKSSPCEDELVYIESKDEYSSKDHSHWQEQTFFELKDMDIRPVASGRIDWTVTGFNGTEAKPNRQLIMRSQITNIGGVDWQIKLYPKGNHSEYISVYLECLSVSKPDWADTTEFKRPPLPVLAGTPPPRRRRYIAAQVSVLMYNPAEPRTNHFKSDAHQYHKHSTDFGWKYFTHEPRHTFHERKHGQRRAILENDTLAFAAYIRIIDDPTDCLWNNATHAFDLLSSPTTLAPFEGLSARVATTALLFHYLPFRKWLQNITTPSSRLSALQGMLERFLARKLRRKHLRQHGMPSGGDVIAVLHSFRALLERDEQKQLLHDFDSVLGDLSPQHMPVCHNRLRTSKSRSIKEALDTAASGVPSPTLFVELERQRFSESTRKWEKVNNAVKLDDRVVYAGAEYQLYGFVNHVGKLGSGEYATFVRPAGPGSLWYCYHGHEVHSYTQKAAMDRALGKGGRSTLEFLREPIGHSFNESIAYLAMYVRKDQTAAAFAAPAEEAWQIGSTVLRSIGRTERGASRWGPPVPALKTPQAAVSPQQMPARRPPPLPQLADPMDGDDVIMSDAEDNLPVHTFISHAVSPQAKDATIIKTLNYFSGPYYDGQVLAQSGKYHGYGKLVACNGDVYQGQFKHDQFHGTGKMVYAATGNKYNGEWANGLHHGQGTLYEAGSGNVFEGGWLDGRKHGKFTLRGEVTEDDKRFCQICYEREMNVAFYDCGHVLACKQCAAALPNCPVCRKQIIGRLELFGVKISMQ